MSSELINADTLPLPTRGPESSNFNGHDGKPAEVQQELFVCNIASWPLKDDMASMDVPIFSLAKHGDTQIRRYQRGNKSITITPSVLGAATVFDKDLLLYAVSQLIEAQNKGMPVSRTVRIQSYDYLRATKRGDGKNSYQGIIGALRRLLGTQLETNIETGDLRQTQGFGLIEDYKIISERIRSKKYHEQRGTGKASDKDSVTRVLCFEITLSQWLMNGVTHFQVLTLDRGYFMLDKSIDRRFYEIAKWHCRDQALWKINIDLLAAKVGTIRERFKFRSDIRSIIKRQPLPEYLVALDTSSSPHCVVFYTRSPAALTMYLMKKNLFSWFSQLERSQA